MEELSKKLTAEFGTGYDVRELRKIRQFYLEFKNRDSLRPELSWSHYRILLRVKDETARNWYMNEAANQTWSTRQLDSYIRMFDAQYKRDDDNPTIGLILCSEKNEAVVKYSVLADAKQIFASKYELALPKPEELAQQLKMDRLLIEEQMKREGE